MIDHFEIAGVRYVPELAVTPNLSTHRVLTDRERNRSDRQGMPMVFWWKEEGSPITKEWQLYLCAINYGMTLEKVSALLNNGRMTSNAGDGFGGRPSRNYILNEGMSNPETALPRWSKVFTCGDAMPQIANGRVTMFDGNMPPPLVYGLNYSTLTREQALDPRSYKYLPENAPHLFYAAVTVNDDGSARPWANGGVYSWYKDGRAPASWFPHVARSVITYPVNSTVANAAVCVRL